VNGAFAKTFKSGLQPIEITSALRRELDTKAAVVSRDRILVPNRFTVRLSSGDYAQMTAIGPTSSMNSSRLVQQHAAAQHYQFSGGISITLAEDPGLTQGVLGGIDSVRSRAPLPEPRCWMSRASVTPSSRAARSSAVATTPTSPWMTPASPRKHVEILWDDRAEVNDLGSTNGSQLNRPVHKAPLAPDARSLPTSPSEEPVLCSWCSPNQRRLTSSPIPVPTTVSAAVNE
jgi:hypothetical protein